MKGKRVPSPVSTGGGGDQFEQQVDAFALGLLLVRATPPVLSDTSLVEVHLQTRHFGWQTDDLLLVGERDDGTQRNLALQVKRTFTVSARNDDCQETVLGMWRDFLATDRFRASADQLAVVTLHGTSVLLQHFGSLLQCARASISAEDFDHRLSVNGFLSEKAKHQNGEILSILTEEGEAPSATDYWRFLRVVNVLSFDFNTPTSQTKSAALSLLSACSVDGGASNRQARATWAALLECAGEGRPSAKSYAREDLPSELLARHSPVSGGDQGELRVLLEHGQTVRDGIRAAIGHDYTIDRGSHIQTLATKLEDHHVVIVSGVAGSGKSALAKELLAQLENSNPVIAFQAVELATAHIDETLANAQVSLNLQRLLALMAGQDRKIVLIDGVERLLEHTVRDAFTQLLQLSRKNPTIRIILTVRDYSLETVRSALIPTEVGPGIFEVPTLSDAELDAIRDGVPVLTRPLGNRQLRALLRTPYLVDLASRLRWTDSPFPTGLRDFRRKVWRDVIRADGYAARGMPLRRERAFLDITWRRAVELRPFVRAGRSDAEALEALRRDSLVYTPRDSSAVYAVTHDVLEDWGVLQSLENQFAETSPSLAALAASVGGYPAIRRGLRQLLAEQFELRPTETQSLVLRAIGEENLPPYFKDDCLVAALLSESAGGFVEGCRPRIAAGDLDLLARMTHMLRVACKESPRWLDVPALPSQLLVPTGPGWVPTLRLVADLVDVLLPERTQLLLGLIEDWVAGINWQNAAPEGVAEAGLIVDRILPQLDGYGLDDTRKRALSVVARIPSAVPQFEHIIERAKTCSYSDRVASGLSHLVLTKLEGAAVCRDFPDEVISLMNARLRLSEPDPENHHLRSGLGEVDYGFGVRELEVGSYSPASALQGPFGALLRSHPQKAVQFILSLLNHAADWFATQQWSGRRLEPAFRAALVIPNFGTANQWANGRLFSLYRGNQVGPACIVSALMALESWLLSLGKLDQVNLEPWLLYLLRNSNNVMSTGVVASVCSAYPEKAAQAGLALLSSKDVVQLDRDRLASESSAGTTAFFGLNPAHRIFEQERVTSKELPHRQEDLESLAVRMQFTEHRPEVWATIDRHRAEVSAEPTEDTQVWRLALHRMDIRHFERQEAPNGPTSEADEDGTTSVYFGPGKLEADLQEMVDRSTSSLLTISRFLGLQNLAREMWQRTASDEQVDWRTSLLAEAQAVEGELGEPEDYFRDGPGVAAAVCIRDHLDELDHEDFEWCALRVDSEVRRKSETADYTDRVGRILGADRACASVVPLLAVHARSVEKIDTMELLALSLTHPIIEVSEYAVSGLGAFVGEEHRALILQCVAAAAYRARLADASWEHGSRRQAVDPQSRRDPLESVVPAVRRAIQEGGLDVGNELESLDLDSPSASAAIEAILPVLERHPDWEESRYVYSRVASWIVDGWRSDERDSHGTARNYELESLAVRSLASFVLRLPWTEAERISAPVVDAVADRRQDVERFVSALVTSADRNTGDCFWELWQTLADQIAGSRWGLKLADEHSFGLGLLDRIFLGHYWNENVKHWHRLATDAHRLDDLARRLPATVPVLRPYTTFLSTIGRESLPESFKVVANILGKGDTVRLASDSTVAFNLETVLRPSVYGQPHRLKADPRLRRAILAILDALVAGGSSAAYRMRDDFVTPYSQG